MNPTSTTTLIVGSGVAGAALAHGLLIRDMGPVVMLEAGPRIQMRDRRSWLDHVATGATPYEGCSDARDDVPVADRNWLSGSRLFARGGTALHWGGWAPRLKPEDFRLHTVTGRGADWPISYSDLESHYLAAEHLLGVAGDSGNMDPPRSGPYPFHAIPTTQVDRVVTNAFEALGYRWSAMPIARNVLPWNGHAACQAIGTCQYCPIGGRFTPDQILDRLELDPRFHLRTGAVVRAVLMDRRNRAAAVEYFDVSSRRIVRQEADHIVLCAGALETPKLLLGSVSADWRSGIGNSTSHVGRHLTWHPLLYARGWKSSNPRRLQHELNFPTLCSRHFDNEVEQAGGKFFMFVPALHPRVDVAALVRSGVSPSGIKAAADGPHQLELQGFVERVAGREDLVRAGRGLSQRGLPGTILRRGQDLPADALRRNLGRMTAALRAAGYTVISSGMLPSRGDHAAGTCRMSGSDRDGVVDSNLRVHGVENLFVCSNAVFPSSGAVNPTLTLTALALRLAAHLPAKA